MNAQIEADVAEVEANKVLSMHHVWTKLEMDDYDSMHYRGRTLYDNLRTQKGYDHETAHAVAHRKYGLCPTLSL